MHFDPLCGLVSFEKAGKFISIFALVICVLYILSHFAGTGYIYEDNSGSVRCVQIPHMPSGVGSCQSIPMVQSHGAMCDENNYCDELRGLICTSGKCACAAERENTSPKYDLVWDNQVGNCLASVGSACVGTRLHPATAGERTVQCVASADCIDADGQTPGLGVCRSRTPDLTTTTTTTATTTTPCCGVSAVQIASVTMVALLAAWVVSSCSSPLM